MRIILIGPDQAWSVAEANHRQVKHEQLNVPPTDSSLATMVENFEYMLIKFSVRGSAEIGGSSTKL